ncbi:integrase arm-type DNA-binding domain-containing protein [Prodigiosinella confusarubida]|nr:integrase arm-type DNA-binding domain-containing protein [Serratia sp. ATCC 39006]
MMSGTHYLLSAVAVQKAKPADKDYDLTDGHGLTLSIRTSGKKIWYFRYQRPNSATRTNITLGIISFHDAGCRAYPLR